jgi:pimeloyl-ACP methyl ester carboxylesterase
MATAPTPTLLNALDGTALVWTAGTQESDTAVVFLHGVPGPGSEWKPLLSEVGSFARAIAPDLPGFGNTTVPGGFTYTSDEYATFVANLLDELGIATAHLVLHDFGGPWGLTWAARHPQRFASATLINTAHGSTTDGISRPASTAHRYSGNCPWRPPRTGPSPH